MSARADPCDARAKPAVVLRPLSVPAGIAAVLLAVFIAHSHAADRPLREIGQRAASAANVRAELHLARDNRSAKLLITAEVRRGYHVYAMTQPKPFIASEIRLDQPEKIELLGPWRASRPPRIHVHKTLGVELHEHDGRITWTAPVRLIGSVDPAGPNISGHLYAQACNANGCLPPTKYPFAAELGTAGGQARRPDESSREATASPDQAAASTVALDFSKIRPQGAAGTPPLAVVLATAFAAGFILNFMPCVLPVIGLKIMAFAQQAGESRSRALLLNVWYSLGLLSVFLVLATLSVFLGLGWGEQFSSVTFNVILASVVFVFALSFLGVWEIPIPGLVGSGKANDLAHREGVAGAFSKGVLTTVLATPCSGPLLGSALAWAIAQPPAIAYAGFASVGLGMASPYLLIGAFPRLIGFLPRPGAWMDTFKQIMGFVLLGTVVFVLSFVPMDFVLPALALMIGLWAACWWIGRVPLTEPLSRRLGAWLAAGAFAASVGFISFGLLHGIMESRFQRAVDRELAKRGSEEIGLAAAVEPHGNELPWRPFSKTLLERLTAEEKTVLVDFTADWCLTCKSNEAIALNTETTRNLVRANGVVTLKADKTQPAPEVDEMLRLLGNTSGAVPFYAIFPAGRPNSPILLDGLFTSARPILDALNKAGPSKDVTTRVAVR